jgi:dTDP-4-amino-4,6-dideoxygalactose transaminase
MSEEIPLFKVNMSSNLESVVNTLKSGMITQGKKVDEFEDKLKEYFNYPYILTLNSATSGLTLAYRLLVNDEEKADTYVISTPLTCFATTTAILANNLKIIWADTDEKTCNIDLEDVKRKINKNTKILSFVHWGGNAVNLDKVEELKKYAKEKYDIDLKVVEDCAHAFGTKFAGQYLGAGYNNIAVYSLQAIKHLTSGDGGLIFLPTEELYERAKLLRWFGIDRTRRSKPGSDFRLEPDISEYGYKFHMNDISASIGLENLSHIINTKSIESCKYNGLYLQQNLKNIEGIELFDICMNSEVSFWIYTIKVKNGRKNEFMNYMKSKKIVVSQVHARNDNHSCVKKYKCSLPNLDIIENEIVSIPSGFWLSESQLEYIVESIRLFFNK